jgi:hypothetical protein
VKRSRARLGIGDETTKEKQMKPDSEHPAAIPKTLHADNCSDRVVFILPQLPPAHCGLGDYSMILLGHMRLEPAPKILVMHGLEKTREKHPEIDVEQLPGSSKALQKRLYELRAQKVFVQYVAQGFQSRGCPLWFLVALRKWRANAPGARLVIMFQELWFEPAFWKPDWLLQKLHRQALCQLAQKTNQVYVSAQGFKERLENIVPPSQLAVLINPATVPLTGSVSHSMREPGLTVLFGRQASRLSALSAMGSWLGRLHAAGVLKELWLVGSRETQALNEREDALAASLLPEGAVHLLGPQTPERLSQILLKSPMGICAKATHGYTKSTIFMAYASHGVSILSPETINDYSPALCWVTHPSEILDGAVKMDQVRERGELLARWYEQNASWDHVAATYRKALGLV